MIDNSVWLVDLVNPWELDSTAPASNDVTSPRWYHPYLRYLSFISVDVAGSEDASSIFIYSL